MQTPNWSAEQRRQQVCEMLRNKGIICKDYLMQGFCPRSPTCPYMHVKNGEVRAIPCNVCSFFQKGVCLRDKCTYFHGTPEQLSQLRATGAELYRPQDFMQIASPPSEYLDKDGNISGTASINEKDMRIMAAPANTNMNNNNERSLPLPSRNDMPFVSILPLSPVNAQMPNVMPTPTLVGGGSWPPFQYQYVQAPAISSFSSVTECTSPNYQNTQFYAQPQNAIMPIRQENAGNTVYYSLQGHQ